MPGSNYETWSQICDDLGSNIICWSCTYSEWLITASDYVDILGSQVHLMVQVLFPNNDAVFQDYSPYTQPCVFSFREQGEKQIPSIISQASRGRVVQYSTRDCSELT